MSDIPFDHALQDDVERMAWAHASPKQPEVIDKLACVDCAVKDEDVKVSKAAVAPLERAKETTG